MNNILAFFIILSSLNIDELKELARGSFDKAEKQVVTVVVTPDVPVIEKCPCDGKGYIVQGDGHRSDCPGTSKGPCEFRKEKPVPEIKIVPPPVKTVPVKHAVITMYTRPGCIWCARWEKFIKPKLIASGWKVTDPVFDSSSNPVPNFDVTIRGVTEHVNEYLTIEMLNTINSKYMGN